VEGVHRLPPDDDPAVETGRAASAATALPPARAVHGDFWANAAPTT